MSSSTREARLTQLLDIIRTRPGHRWSVGQIQGLRRLTGGPTQRGTARHDMQELYRRGHLNQHGPADDRYYTLRRKAGDR